MFISLIKISLENCGGERSPSYEGVSTNLNSFSQRYISEQTGEVEGTEKAIS